MMTGCRTRARWLSGLLLWTVCLVLAQCQDLHYGKLHRRRRASLTCPSDKHVTAPAGQTCARVWWTAPSGSNRHNGLNPGDCVREGVHEVKYEYYGAASWHWIKGDSCSFKIYVTVLRCSSLPPQIADGTRTCTSSSSPLLYGTVCTYQCTTPGYKMIGSSRLRCEKPPYSSTRVTWNNQVPSCPETCSWTKNHCWPGDCSNELASNCVCRPGFKPRRVNGAYRCDLNTPPIMTTCRVRLFDTAKNDIDSRYTGNLTDCDHQRNETIQNHPTRLHFKIGAHLPEFSHSVVANSSYIYKSDLGVVGTKVTVVVVSPQGTDTTVKSQHFNKMTACGKNVDSRHPINHYQSLECEAHMTFSVNLTDGDRLCVDMESFSGGYYILKNDATNMVIRSPSELFTPVSAKKRVCFLYDPTPPRHCSDQGCGHEPLELSTRLTDQPEVGVHVQGWADPEPVVGRSDLTSGVFYYKLEVHGVLVDTSPFVVAPEARAGFGLEWNASDSTQGVYDLTLRLPPDQPRLYAVVLEVHDHARADTNVAYARRFVLLDNSSHVEINGSLRAVSASQRLALAVAVIFALVADSSDDDVVLLFVSSVLTTSL